MNIRKLFPLLLTVGLIIIGAFFWLRHDPSSSLDSTNNSTPPVSRPQSSGNPKIRIDAIRSSRPTAIYDSVSSYVQLEATLTKAPIDPAQKAEYLRTAAMFCEAALDRKASVAASPRTATSSDIAYRKFASNFCVGFNDNSDARHAQVLEHPESDVAIAQMLLADAENAQEQEKEIADRIVRTSQEPSAMLAAAGVLVSGTPGSWDLGRNLAKSTVQSGALPDAQWLAVRMRACDYSGGCGPSGFYTMVECVNYQACRPGISLFEIWQSNVAPPTFQLATAIHAELAQTNAM